MIDGVTYNAILHNFGFSDVAVTKFTENYCTSRELMISNTTDIKEVINQQNKMYRNHAIPNQHCYTNATKMNRILGFHH